MESSLEQFPFKLKLINPNSDFWIELLPNFAPPYPDPWSNVIPELLLEFPAVKFKPKSSFM